MDIITIEKRLWEMFCNKQGIPLSKNDLDNDGTIPNYRKCSRLGISIYKLNKLFHEKYITEINIKNCKECNSILTTHDKIFCNRSCAAKYNNIGRVHSTETKQKLSDNSKYYIHNIGKCSKIFRKCLICDNTFKVYANSKREYCSHKCNPNLGGFREGAGYSKSGYYKGIYCGSTYELVWVMYRLDNNLEVKRFEGYIEENGKKYFPDFYVDNKIIEIKGRHTEEVDIKTKMALDAGFNIEVKYKKDLQAEFEWVKKNYVYKEVYELYDNHRPKYSYVCNYCGTIISTNKIKKTDTKFCNTTCVGKFMALKRKIL